MPTQIEQLWVQLSLPGNDKVVIGCLYRSPTMSTRECPDELCQLLQTVCASAPSHLLIGGDFNMPQIEWENSFSTAPPQDVTHQFLEVLNDCFLTQHVTQPTRFCPGETPHILDLILTNEDGMIKNLVHESGLGKSDHVILRFELACYTYQQELPTIHPNYFKGNPDKLNKLLQKVDWEEKRVTLSMLNTAT